MVTLLVLLLLLLLHLFNSCLAFSYTTFFYFISFVNFPLLLSLQTANCFYLFPIYLCQNLLTFNQFFCVELWHFWCHYEIMCKPAGRQRTSFLCVLMTPTIMTLKLQAQTISTKCKKHKRINNRWQNQAQVGFLYRKFQFLWLSLQ